MTPLETMTEHAHIGVAAPKRCLVPPWAGINSGPPKWSSGAFPDVVPSESKEISKPRDNERQKEKE